jgi:lipoprotein-releasing system permease protein
VLFELKLATRYFRSKRKSLTRFTALISIVGIAGGVAALIFANALARGFQDEMQEKILSNTSHITIFRKDGDEIRDFQQIRFGLEKLKNVEKIDATTYESALLIGEKTTSYCVLRVIENFPNDFAIGKELAEKTGVKIGDNVEIITSSNDAAKTSDAKVQDIFQTGLYDYDLTWIYLSPNKFNQILDNETFFPTVLSLTLSDIYEAKQTANLIRQNLSEEYKIVDWQEANKPFFAALSLEKKVSFAIILLIIFIAVLNITTTLALFVNERKADIAVLRTCGATTKNISSVFMLQGFILGLFGILVGVIIGILGIYLSNYFRLISLDTEVYSIASISLQTSLLDLLLIVIFTFFLTNLAAIYPAWKASGIKPLENFRNNS